MEQLRKIPFYPEQTPPMDSYVIAEVQSFTDVVVEVLLPEYGNLPAIIPTSEIKVKRGRRVGDYVKKGKEVVAQVIRVDEEGRLDLSMKVVTQDDDKGVRERYAKAQKVHSIVCTASNYKEEDVRALYNELHSKVENLYAYFEGVLVGEAPCESEALVKAIHMRLVVPSYTVEKEISILSLTAEATEAKLTALVEQGFKVYVTAPPKYKITATASSPQKAEQQLSGALLF